MSTTRSNTAGADDVALLLGRICLIALFLPSGITKLLNYGRFASSLAARTLPFGIHLPFPELFAVLAVAIEVGGPLLLLFGIQTRWVALTMIAFVIMATLISHRYWEMEEQLRRVNSSSFYKNIGVVGGLLCLYVSGAGQLSWEGWRRRDRPRP
jgi:putative oxidoreductase